MIFAPTVPPITSLRYVQMEREAKSEILSTPGMSVAEFAELAPTMAAMLSGPSPFDPPGPSPFGPYGVA